MQEKEKKETKHRRENGEREIERDAYGENCGREGERKSNEVMSFLFTSGSGTVGLNDKVPLKTKWAFPPLCCSLDYTYYFPTRSVASTEEPSIEDLYTRMPLCIVNQTSPFDY